MCGIAGQFGKIDTYFASNALNQLKHRGPDSHGSWSNGRDVFLIHTRLAVIDIAPTGNQPMQALVEDATASNLDRCQIQVIHGDMGEGSMGNKLQTRACLVFNGEIYNYKEIKRDLVSRGVVFSGESDSEVLLYSLLLDGRKSLQKLNGMFAFAYWDCATQTGLLARDPLGIKPLYYRISDDGVSFASESNVLAEKSDLINPTGIRDYFLWGSFQEPNTSILGVNELPAGSLLHWRGGRTHVEKWSRILFRSKNRISKKPAQYTRQKIQECVARHLQSDVPLGIFLSGGVDSTAILALVRNILGKEAKIHTFSIGFKNDKADESTLAKRTAEHFQTEHKEWIISPEEGESEILPFLQAADQPTIDGFNVWCVCKLARNAGLKVALSGQGGDELFGGYPSFRRVPYLFALHRILGFLRKPIASGIRFSKSSSKWRRLQAYLNGTGSWLEAFHCQRGIFTLEQSNRLAQHFTGQNPAPIDWHNDVILGDDAEVVAFFETKKYLRNQLLRDSDIFSMAHGLELRVPFVDSLLINELNDIPARYRFRPYKQLLIEAVPEIPPWILNRSKKGFSFPFEKWMKSGFGDMLKQACEDVPVNPVTWYQVWAIATFVISMKSRQNKFNSSPIQAL
jgi:asparagine synthase (glutamine-hydrolysing)